jgi:hypothetical protein
MIKITLAALLYVVIQSSAATRRYPELYEGFEEGDYLNQDRLVKIDEA